MEIHYGNTGFGNHLRLFSETGYNLTMRESGEILGSDDDNDSDSHLEILSAGEVAHVRIRSMKHQLYVCFDSDGNLYGEPNSDNDGTIFEEHFQASYSGFRSVKYPDWYIGIKKSGQAKNGKRTKFGQKAVKFLPRRLN